MNKRLLMVGSAGLALCLGAVVARAADDLNKAIAKLPDSVTKTFKRSFPKGGIVKLDVEEENGVTVYDFEFKDGAIEKETDITADGVMLEFTVVVDAKAVPRAAMKAVRKAAEGATMKRIELVEIAYETKDGKTIKLPKPITHYAVEMAKGERTTEIVVAPDGAVVEPAKRGVGAEQKAKEDQDGEDEDEDDEATESATQAKREAKGKTSEFVGSFEVDKANLVSAGKNPYFILEPGYRLQLKDEGGTLTITVLNDTKLVDGVETRVVEEREEKNGQLAEVSRNYFAIDKATHSVYYFGEDVDDYKDGRVVGHGGSWLAGVNGAKFGLMMPGDPKPGAKFYQEQAPGTAMDRCEVVAVNEAFTTPAGKFKNCLRTRESSALESGSEEKIYAPGVGLLKDEDFLLASHGPKGATKKRDKAKAR